MNEVELSDKKSINPFKEVLHLQHKHISICNVQKSLHMFPVCFDVFIGVNEGHRALCYSTQSLTLEKSLDLTAFPG